MVAEIQQPDCSFHCSPVEGWPAPVGVSSLPASAGRSFRIVVCAIGRCKFFSRSKQPVVVVVVCCCSATTKTTTTTATPKVMQKFRRANNLHFVSICRALCVRFYVCLFVSACPGELDERRRPSCKFRLSLSMLLKVQVTHTNRWQNSFVSRVCVAFRVAEAGKVAAVAGQLSWPTGARHHPGRRLTWQPFGSIKLAARRQTLGAHSNCNNDYNKCLFALLAFVSANLPVCSARETTTRTTTTTTTTSKNEDKLDDLIGEGNRFKFTQR